MNYLSAISDELGESLLAIGGPIDIASRYYSTGLDAELQEIADDSTVSETEKRQLLKARVGQGIFRKKVAAREPCCRVTGVTDLSLLRASHIKPWRLSTNEERLDGSNGLMLSPHIDLLFDQHLISFGEDGSLLTSPKLDSIVLSQWSITEAYRPRPFAINQEKYLQIHRNLTLGRINLPTG
nr:HNH endonuclease [Luteibacter sp. SG786]